MDILDRVVRVEIKDGRILIGNLVCVDGDCNLILNNSTEIRTIEIVQGHFEECKREIGMVLILGHDLVKCEVEEEKQ